MRGRCCILWFVVCVVLCAIADECSKNNIGISETLIDDGDILQIAWIPPVNNIPNEVIFIVGSKNSLWRSSNGGVSFEQQNIGPVIQVYPSAHHDKIYFLGKEGSLWTTEDGGLTYIYKPNSFVISAITPHPTLQEWAFATAPTDHCFDDFAQGTCMTELKITKDLGSNWVLIKPYVNEVLWGQGDTIFYTSWRGESADQRSLNTNTLTFQRITNLATRQAIPDYVIPKVVEFTVTGSAVTFAKLKYDDSTWTSTELELWISTNNGKSFERILFPSYEKDLVLESYEVVASWNSATFIDIFKTNGYGTTYMSLGSEDRKFTESLPHTKRNQNGDVDFYQIKGIDGIYIANKILNPEKKTDESWQTQTVISYDMGSQWQTLAPPSDLMCPLCSLHLFGKAESSYSHVHSTENGIGLIIAAGTVGTFLENNKNISTFLSRDAGSNWVEVGKGDHVFEFGDHGAILVLTKANVKTTDLIFSWNEGQTIDSCQFDDIGVNVVNITVEPTGTSKHFLLHGIKQLDNGSNVGVVVHIDFSNFWDGKCEDDDYEDWSPTDMWGDACILGQKFTYSRKKRESNCFNSFDQEKKTKTVDHCICTGRDYECDFCFSRNSAGQCVLSCIDYDLYAVEPANCVEFWNKTKGYQKIYGTECIGTAGSVWEPEVLPCTQYSTAPTGDRHLESLRAFVITLLVLFVLSLLVAVAYVILTGKTRKRVELEAV